MVYRTIPGQKGHYWISNDQGWISPATQNRPAILATRKGSQWVAVFADWPHAVKVKARGLNKAANALLEKLQILLEGKDNA